MDGLINMLVEFFHKYFTPELIIFIISLMPILELRGGLVAAALLGVRWEIAFPICVLANLLPIPLAAIIWKRMIAAFKRTKLFRRLGEKMEEKVHNKSEGARVKYKYKLLGLLMFVAIPIPGTGAWTGALVADALDIRMKRSLPIIAVGVIIAGLIISALSYLIPGLI